jgi:hypothetical protein
VGKKDIHNGLLTRTALFIVISLTLLGAVTEAAENNQVTNISISIQRIFSLEFYTDENVLYSGTVPFSNVDPTKPLVYPNGREENDGKSDVGAVCRSNSGSTWYLKLHLLAAHGLAPENLKYYIDQPYNRNTSARTDGALAQPPNWYPFRPTAFTVYTAGDSDKSNLPFGTLLTFSYALNPAGLEAGKSYSAAITYTMTTTP